MRRSTLSGLGLEARVEDDDAGEPCPDAHLRQCLSCPKTLASSRTFVFNQLLKLWNGFPNSLKDLIIRAFRLVKLAF